MSEKDKLQSTVAPSGKHADNQIESPTERPTVEDAKAKAAAQIRLLRILCEAVVRELTD